MNSYLLYLIINAFAYILALIYYIKKYSFSNVGVLLYSIYTLSNVFAIFYYEIGIHYGVVDVVLYPEGLVYMYVCITICLFPLMKSGTIKSITLTNSQERMLKCLIWVFCLISLLPFCENLLLLPKEKDAYALHMAVADGDLRIYSPLANGLNNYCRFFRSFYPVLFFVLLQYKRIPKYYIYLISVPIVNIILGGYNSGTRGDIVCYSLMIIPLYLIMNGIYREVLKSKIKKAGILLISGMVVLFTLISISRYNNGANTMNMNESLLLYISEGPIRFSGEKWKKPLTTNGDVNLNYFKHLIGAKTFLGYREREEYYVSKTGHRIEVFYTYVGDLLSDFGYIGTIIVCLVLMFYWKKNYREKDMSIPSLVIMANYIQFLGVGFASNVYRASSLQMGFFYTLILCILLHCLGKIGKCRLIYISKNN